MQQHGIVLYLFNAVENEWEYTSGIKNASVRDKRIRGTNQFADSYLFANADRSPFIYISPTRISDQFIKYFETVSGTRVTVYVPEGKTYSVCRNLMQDKATVSAIIREAKLKGSRINLYSYASTPELHELKEFFEKKGMNVTAPETPKKDSLWTVTYYGSKCGIRDFFSKQDNTSALMPKGYICQDIPQAVEKAYELYRANGGVVIKTNRGCSGDGVLIFGNGKLPHALPDFTRKLNTIFLQNDFWKTNPIAVESFIKTDGETSFPSIEYIVDDDGSYRMLYYCLMTVTPEGEFYGMDMNRDIYPPGLVARMEAIGAMAAEAYAKNGYRGHFDIDMILDRGRLYVTESNTRNTGGTDAYKITKQLLGSDFFSNHYVISRYLYLGKEKRLHASEVFSALNHFLYDPATKTGIILTSESVFRRHGISYVCIAKDRKTAYELDSRIARAVTSSSK